MSSLSSRQTSNNGRALQPPKQRGWPLLGNIKFAGDKAKYFRASPGGGISRVQLLGSTFVVISDPKLAETIYRSEGTLIGGITTWKTFNKLFGDGSLFCLFGKPHKRLRSCLISCFRHSDLLKTAIQVQDITTRHLNAWAAASDLDDARPKVEDFAFELGMSFIGVDHDSLAAAEAERLCSEVHDFTAAFVSLPVNLGKWSQYGRGILARKHILQLVTDTVNERKRDNKEKSPNMKKRMVENDLLQRMLDVRDEDGEPLPMSVMQDTMLSFVSASFETTAGSINAFLLNMCRFPEVQEKAHVHIREVLGEDSEEYKGAFIRDEQWEQLQYIDQIINENRRFDPPVSISGTRTVLKDFELGGYRVRKGSTILIETLTASRSPDLWENPNTFDPDRFDKSRPNYKRMLAQLQTFGGGSKTCVGKGFAQLELKVIMTLLMRDYKIEFADPDSVPNVTYPENFILDGPLQVKFTRRENVLKADDVEKAEDVVKVDNVVKEDDVAVMQGATMVSQLERSGTSSEGSSCEKVFVPAEDM